MEKEPDGWIRFRIGDVFPANSAIARFLVGLGMIEIDLITTNAAIVKHLTDLSDTSPDAILLFWNAAAQLREAAKFIVKAMKNDEVRAFVGTLPVEGQDSAGAIVSACEPWDNSFVQRVTKPIRDGLYHYPCLDHPAWAYALAATASNEAGVRIRGRKTEDVRAFYADEIRSAFLSRYLGTTRDEMRESMGKIAELNSHAVRLSQIALTKYLSELPADAVRIENIEHYAGEPDQ